VSWLALTLVTLSLLCGVYGNRLRAHSLPMLRRPYQPAAGWSSAPTSEVLRWQRSGQMLLVDTRTPPEFFGSHIPGAVNLCELNFEREYPCLQSRLRQASRVVLYDSGAEPDWAAPLAARLAASGVERVSVMQEGLLAWQSLGGPYEQVKPP